MRYLLAFVTLWLGFALGAWYGFYERESLLLERHGQTTIARCP